MAKETFKTFYIREINSQSQIEIEWVASRMRQTLIEVMGEERGGSYYSIDWLRDRVRWHLDPKNTTARIYLAEDSSGRVIGQAVVRIDNEDDGKKFGYFSTLFVEQDSRRLGIATSLLEHVEIWVRGYQLPKLVYNTAHNNVKLICLFQKYGFEITLRDGEMVQLTKPLSR